MLDLAPKSAIDFIKESTSDLSDRECSILFWKMVCNPEHPLRDIFDKWKTWKILKGEWRGSNGIER